MVGMARKKEYSAADRLSVPRSKAPAIVAPASGEPIVSHWSSPTNLSGMAHDDPDEIVAAGSTITVCLPDGAGASFQARSTGWPQDVLLDDLKTRRFIGWQCRAPNCEVDFGDGSPLADGYVETLRMHLPRLSIPIDRLHWGRFVAESWSLVWIVWEGPVPRRQAWLNGVNVDLECFTTSVSGDVSLRVSGADFKSEQTREIIARPLQTRLSAALGAFAALLPRALRSLEERKHLGRGRLMLADGAEIQGWTLSETVNVKMERR